jgi:hypothetical protein
MQEEQRAAAPYRPSVMPAPLTDANASGVSWGAIFAGAAAAAAISFILIILGFGLGMSVISPWSGEDTSATTIGISTIVWLLITQIIASGLGGYLAGRLRVKWSSVHHDEVYFRDTAHGMLSWAIATLVTAAFLGSAIAGVVGGGAKLAGTVASGAAMGSGALVAQASGNGGGEGSDGGGVMSYFVDTMFRSETPPQAQDASQMRSEAGRILANSIRRGELSAEDRTYLASMVARSTGISPQEAEKRVNDLYTQATQTIEQTKTQAKEAADTARKAAAGASLWMFVALLAGAFFASLAALWGGRRREAEIGGVAR